MTIAIHDGQLTKDVIEEMITEAMAKIEEDGVVVSFCFAAVVVTPEIMDGKSGSRFHEILEMAGNPLVGSVLTIKTGEGWKSVADAMPDDDKADAVSEAMPIVINAAKSNPELALALLSSFNRKY